MPPELLPENSFASMHFRFPREAQTAEPLLLEVAGETLMRNSGLGDSFNLTQNDRHWARINGPFHGAESEGYHCKYSMHPRESGPQVCCSAGAGE